MKAKVRTCLWFDGNGLDAARFYVSLIPGSALESPSSGQPLMVDFHLAGTPYQALNGGPQFTHSEAASISVLTRNQEETDRLWNTLTADGGIASRCGWLKDRFGLSWQIVPEVVPAMLGSSDREAAERAMQALLGMGKIEIAALHSAFAGKSS